MGPYSAIIKRMTALYILCCLMVPALCACGNGPMKKRPVAVKGILDLRGWDFERDGSVNLDGEWEFHWNCLLNPPDIESTALQRDSGYMTVPGLWINHTVNGVTLTGEGRATYRLRILGGPDATLKTMTIQRVYSAYRLWINNKLVDERGSVDGTSKAPENYIFVHNKRRSSFTMNEGMNEIVLQVFNRDYGSGGIERPVLLENNTMFERNRNRSHTIDMVVFGLLIFASMYNILFYFFRRQDAASLYFGCFCFSLAVNTLHHQFPLLPEGLAFPRYPYFINYITIISCVPFIQMTIKSLFPDEQSIYVVRFLQFLTLVYIFVLFFVDFRTAEMMMWVYYIIIIIITAYNEYSFIHIIRNRRQDAILFVIGFTPVFIGAINDILYGMWIVNTTVILKYGVVLLCVVTTVVISRRFARALWRVEELSKDLAEKNISLLNLDRLKDQFLAATSHELRTPLHGMIGLSESMLEGAAGAMSPEARENLSLIASSGHRLANMVNDILDMAKIQDEGLNLIRKPVNLHSLCEMVIRLSLPLAAGKPLTITNNIMADLPAAHADEDRIRQVLCNLLGNAIKFTIQGTVELSARVINETAEDVAMMEVRVMDTGIGIPEEYREKIFESYRQVDGNDNRQYPGTGLGLAIAKRIVELHNGALWVEPGAEGGSIFLFTLPVSKDPAPEAEGSVVVEGMDETSTDSRADSQGLAGSIEVEGFAHNPVILAVDDDPICVRVIQNYFESRQCVVKTAPDGVTALAIIEGGEPVDLVLLDIMMPVMSGYDVCRRIRLNHSPGELPVIMLTAKNMMADINAAFEAGANDYIVKPIRVRELMARVGTMLKVRDIRKSAAEGITIRGRDRVYSFIFKEIIYITSHSKNCVLHTVEGDTEVPVLMKDIIDRLPPDLFGRIHKSHVINLRYIHSLSHVISGRYRVRLRDDDETELPVGAAFLDSLRKKMQ